MIKNIELENIQKHKNLKIDFSPGVNVIIGENDKGKTSILRAILWVLYPGNIHTSEIKSWRKLKCKTELVFDKHKVVCHYTKENGKDYLIDEKSFYRGLGGRVPIELMSLFPLDDVNVQRTFDPMFIIGMSSETKYSFIMEKIGIDVFLKLYRFLNEKLRELRKEQKKLEKPSILLEIETIKKSLEKLYSLRDNIFKVEELQKEIDIKINKKIEIENLTQQYYDIDVMKTLAIDCDYVNNLLEKYCTIKKQTEQKINEYYRMNQLLNDFYLLREYYKGQQQSFTKLILEFKEMIDKLKVCPLCYLPLTNENKKRIII